MSDAAPKSKAESFSQKYCRLDTYKAVTVFAGFAIAGVTLYCNLETGLTTLIIFFDVIGACIIYKALDDKMSRL